MVHMISYPEVGYCKTYIVFTWVYKVWRVLYGIGDKKHFCIALVASSLVNVFNSLNSHVPIIIVPTSTNKYSQHDYPGLFVESSNNLTY